MYQYPFRYSFVVLAFMFTFLGGCAKEELDIYKRPASLEPPIYQTLQNKGNFKTLLGVIDKSGYQHTLSSAGYWTFFAPNDEAFTKYFQKSGLSLAALDSTKARSLVQGMLVYNSFLKERLDDYQDAIGWVPSKAFRRRTAYYTGFYDDVNITGTSLKAVAGNRNGFNYVPDDNNNKYISYFINDYFAAKGLSATDYNYFFPEATYSGFNVMNAKVLTQDIVAENGTVHEVDNVITVQPSIDEYLKSKNEYSEFRKLYEKYMVGYSPNAILTNKYQILTGKNTPVFVKGYSNTLAFSPANENFMKLSDNDGQQDCWSVFVPTNDVLLPYIKNVLLENYASLDVVPQQVIIDFLNAHMWGTSVWPSRFKMTFNGLGEEARFDPTSNVVEKKVLSNGFFYGTNKVQESNLFSTVFAKSYLDPKYSIMTRLLNMDLRSVILNPKLKYTVFLMSDAAINAAGYDVKLLDNGTLEWGYTAPGVPRVTGDANRTRLLRIVGTSVVATTNNELDDLSSAGIIDAFNGEYIKYNKNTVTSAGLASPLKIVGAKTAQNGKVYYTDGVLNFTEVNVGKSIELLGTDATSLYNSFWQYFKNSSAYNVTTGEIVGTSSGKFYTVFVPNNDAIKAAAIAGLLPSTGTGAAKTPNFNPTLASEREQVANFIYYHVLNNNQTIIPDGKLSGGFETLLKNAQGDAITVTVISTPGAIQLTDFQNKKAKLVLDKSNNLANRTVIHLIDNYLQYK